MTRQSTRIKRERIDPVAKVAREIDLVGANSNEFRLVDVSNRSEADTRATMRSGAKQTIRRLTKIDKLKRAGIISEREARACEWYQQVFSIRYETSRVVARYGEARGGNKCAGSDHLPRDRAQWDAYHNFEWARQSICPIARPMFERVVIHGRPLGKLAITFRMTAQRLLAHIEGKVAL